MIDASTGVNLVDVRLAFRQPQTRLIAADDLTALNR